MHKSMNRYSMTASKGTVVCGFQATTWFITALETWIKTHFIEYPLHLFAQEYTIEMR